MNLKKAWLAVPAAAALALTACSGGGSNTTGGSSDGIITVNGSEPQNTLLPGMTSENGGGRILAALFSGLVRYDNNGKTVLDVAESIEPNEDNTVWTVKLHNDRKFSDGTPVKASNFVEAWKLITSKNQVQAAFFDFFQGTGEAGSGDITGLVVPDD
ncbi:MAG: ABC transporter substrate-binding protein, partial [Schaalia georgiae]|nr:ABC transporter substrate-binding protein [Schaalia georgiae]